MEDDAVRQALARWVPEYCSNSHVPIEVVSSHVPLDSTLQAEVKQKAGGLT
jgi:hypothetical protein